MREKMIQELLSSVEYGTLALCLEDKPYSVPVNFVDISGVIYFHGARHNRKMRTLKSNPNVSFSVVKNYSIIQSYFSSNEGLACPSTQFFTSLSVDGRAQIVEEKEEKILALSALMQKLQSEGGYRPFEDEAYDKMLKATAVVKIEAETQELKLKFGQKLSAERFEMVLEHLKKRGSEVDLATIEMMKLTRMEKRWN